MSAKIDLIKSDLIYQGEIPEEYRILADSGNDRNMVTVVWNPDINRYFLISGAEQLNALRNLRVAMVPCIVYGNDTDPDNETASQMQMKPSQMAEICKHFHEALGNHRFLGEDISEVIRQKHPKLFEKENKAAKEYITTAKIAAAYLEMSESQFRRYAELGKLSSELLRMVDEQRIALNAALKLVKLPQETQDSIVGILESQENSAYKLSMKTADAMKSSEDPIAVMLCDIRRQKETRSADEMHIKKNLYQTIVLQKSGIAEITGEAYVDKFTRRELEDEIMVILKEHFKKNPPKQKH